MEIYAEKFIRGRRQALESEVDQVFEGYLSSKKYVNSFNRKGNPYDNACFESWYNHKRIHSAIDYMHHQQKENEELKKQNSLLIFFVQSIDTDSVTI